MDAPASPKVSCLQLVKVQGSTEERDRMALIAPDSLAVNHAVGVAVSSRIVG